jgi:hypothetical protein
MGEDLEHALRYRNRAEELRIQADHVKTEDVRASLLSAAADFERLAIFYEKSASPARG